MDILLLGGTGTLSSAVRDYAFKKGYSVTVFNRGNSNNSLPCGIISIIGDFRNTDGLRRCLTNSNYDVVVDFLSRTKSDIERVFPTFQGKCKQYIFISSACVYQRDNTGKKIAEDCAKPNHNWSYSVEKYECEQSLKELSLANSYTSYTIVRPYITYDDERIPLGISPVPYHLHRTIIERIKAGKPWFVWDDGHQITTVTHASDFAVAVVGLFMNSKAMNDDFHITGDDCCTQLQIVETIFHKLQIKPNIIHVETDEICRILPEYRGMLIADRALDAQFDNTKIKSVVPNLNFSTSIEEGIERVLDCWEKSSIYDYDYKFEGRIDRLMSRYCKANYDKYPHARWNSVVIYGLYRYLPLRLASKIAQYVK